MWIPYLFSLLHYRVATLDGSKKGLTTIVSLPLEVLAEGAWSSFLGSLR